MTLDFQSFPSSLQPDPAVLASPGSPFPPFQVPVI